MKLALLAVILMLLSLITLMALFSWAIYVAGMAFLGVQLRSVFINYQLGRDVLYRFPGTTKPLLMRHWNAEEKAELFQAKLEKLAADYKCPLDIINSEALRAEALAQETREGLEKVVFEGFQRDYSQYFQTLNKQKLEASWSLADGFNGVCDFAYNHPIFCLLAAGATAAVIYWALRSSGGNPINELREQQVELRKEILATNDLLEKKLAAIEERLIKDPVKVADSLLPVNENLQKVADQSVNLTTDIRTMATVSNEQNACINDLLDHADDIADWRAKLLR